MLPHPSFDVDGDGVVSQKDYRLARRFDTNNDGVLQRDERDLLRKKMVADTMGKEASAAWPRPGPFGHTVL